MSKNLFRKNGIVDVDVMDLNQMICLHKSHHNLKELQLNFCGGYRSRTDDPLRARQML